VIRCLTREHCNDLPLLLPLTIICISQVELHAVICHWIKMVTFADFCFRDYTSTTPYTSTTEYYSTTPDYTSSTEYPTSSQGPIEGSTTDYTSSSSYGPTDYSSSPYTSSTYAPVSILRHLHSCVFAFE